jgi:CHRD domain
MTRRRVTLGSLAVLLGAFVVVALTVGATSAKPPVKKFTATLNVGQETGVVKSTKRGAAGMFTATLSGTSLTYKLTFAHLSGAATAAHIHGPAARHVSAAILVPLCGPTCTSPVSGTATLSSSEISLMEAGKTYVNVHTAKNPNGEIRGQITSVG